MKIVKVVYKDLTEYPRVSNLEDVSLKILEIFGYLIEEDKVIKIIKEYDWDKTEHQVMIIPKSVVIGIKELKIGRNINLKNGKS